MPNLEPVKLEIETSISDRINQFKYDPTGMINVILDHMENALNNKVDIIDPTNPFVLLLETAVVTSSSAVMTSLEHLRKQFPTLARDREDIYHHMTYLDYVGIFANPGNAKFTIMYRINELIDSAISVPSKGYDRLQIPRFSTIIVGNDLIFTILYPITIDIWSKDNIQIRYDTSIKHPFKPIKDHIIPHHYVVDKDNNRWLVFDIDIWQLTIDSNSYPILPSSTFKQTIDYKDKLYIVRAYYKNNSTNNTWVELPVTYSDIIFDPLTPTILIKDINNKIEVTIPNVYIINGNLSGELRIDIYTTKGNFYYNLSDIDYTNIQIDYNTIDPSLDTNNYTAPIANIPVITFSNDILYNGTDPIDIETLRERVIHNTTGPIDIPITEEELITYVNNKGFELYKAYDVLTKRIYIAYRWLPTTSEIKDKGLLSSIELTRETLVNTVNNIEGNQSIISRSVNRVIIPHDTVFKIDNGNLIPISNTEYTNLQTNTLSTLNNNNYYNNLFHTIIDVFDKSINVRSYDLLNSTVENIDIVAVNENLDPKADIIDIQIEKQTNLYIITVKVDGNNEWKAIPDSYTGIAMILKIVNSSNTILIDGVYDSTVDGLRIYKFYLDTDNDIDQYHGISLTNIPNINKLFVSLNNDAMMYTYITDPSYPIVSFIHNTDLTSLNKTNLQVLSKEKISVIFGYYLDKIWNRPRITYTETKYQTYDTDIYAFYEEDVYKIDPATGSPFIVNQNCDISVDILHRKGEPILDVEGNHIIKHKKGDTILDNEGNPIIDIRSGIQFHTDVILYPAEYMYSTDISYKKHRLNTLKLVRDWILSDIDNLNNVTLELTDILYSPISKSGPIEIDIGNNKTVTVDSSYSPNITLYVSEQIANNPEELNLIKNGIGEIIIRYLRNRKLSITEFKNTIINTFNNVLLGVDINNFLPFEEYEVFTIVKEDERFTINRKLIETTDKKYKTIYDIEFTTVIIR